jgi:hypothetical protein
MTQPDRLGPRTVTTTVETCEGCPALRLQWWEDGDGRSHTQASCAARAGDASPFITSYWRPLRHPPPWCPHQARSEAQLLSRRGRELLDQGGPDVA